MNEEMRKEFEEWYELEGKTKPFATVSIKDKTLESWRASREAMNPIEFPSEIVRRSSLFCTLLGVKRIVLAGFNDVKFDTLKAMKLWLELKGYSRLTRSQYRDCYQAWIGKDSVAKVQKMPSGKFLVQEFKIV